MFLDFCLFSGLTGLKACFEFHACLVHPAFVSGQINRPSTQQNMTKCRRKHSQFKSFDIKVITFNKLHYLDDVIKSIALLITVYQGNY